MRTKSNPVTVSAWVAAELAAASAIIVGACSVATSSATPDMQSDTVTTLASKFGSSEMPERCYWW